MRFLPLVFLLPLAASAATKKNEILLRDPTFYDVLRPNTSMLCTHVRDEKFGVFLERGEGTQVKVSVITNGVNEGERTAFATEIKKNEHDLLTIHHYSRVGQFGRFREIVISKRRSPEFGYGLPAMLSEMTAFFTVGADGTEKRDLYADGSFRMSCRPPLPR